MWTIVSHLTSRMEATLKPSLTSDNDDAQMPLEALLGIHPLTSQTNLVTGACACHRAVQCRARALWQWTRYLPSWAKPAAPKERETSAVANPRRTTVRIKQLFWAHLKPTASSLLKLERTFHFYSWMYHGGSGLPNFFPLDYYLFEESQRTGPLPTFLCLFLPPSLPSFLFLFSWLQIEPTLPSRIFNPLHPCKPLNKKKISLG